jgi:ribose 1,5-bisphosphokinase
MAGRLFYVVGASGVGKDTLIAYARERVAAGGRVVFADRYITRANQPGGENHVELTRPEFERRERLGLFAMSWESHGYRYGIGNEIDAWLAQGRTVVVNGSRDHVQAARQRYPDIAVVWISAHPRAVEERLQSRGRESREEIDSRLARNSRLGMQPPPGVLRIDNDGTLEEAGARLVELLTEV